MSNNFENKVTIEEVNDEISIEEITTSSEETAVLPEVGNPVEKELDDIRLKNESLHSSLREIIPNLKTISEITKESTSSSIISNRLVNEQTNIEEISNELFQNAFLNEETNANYKQLVASSRRINDVIEKHKKTILTTDGSDFLDGVSNIVGNLVTGITTSVSSNALTSEYWDNARKYRESLLELRKDFDRKMEAGDEWISQAIENKFPEIKNNRKEFIESAKQLVYSNMHLFENDQELKEEIKSLADKNDEEIISLLQLKNINLDINDPLLNTQQNIKKIISLIPELDKKIDVFELENADNLALLGSLKIVIKTELIQRYILFSSFLSASFFDSDSDRMKYIDSQTNPLNAKQETKSNWKNFLAGGEKYVSLEQFTDVATDIKKEITNKEKELAVITSCFSNNTSSPDKEKFSSEYIVSLRTEIEQLNEYSAQQKIVLENPSLLHNFNEKSGPCVSLIELTRYFSSKVSWLMTTSMHENIPGKKIIGKIAEKTVETGWFGKIFNVATKAVPFINVVASINSDGIAAYNKQLLELKFFLYDETVKQERGIIYRYLDDVKNTNFNISRLLYKNKISSEVNEENALLTLLNKESQVDRIFHINTIGQYPVFKGNNETLVLTKKQTEDLIERGREIIASSKQEVATLKEQHQVIIDKAKQESESSKQEIDKAKQEITNLKERQEELEKEIDSKIKALEAMNSSENKSSQEIENKVKEIDDLKNKLTKLEELQEINIQINEQKLALEREKDELNKKNERIRKNLEIKETELSNLNSRVDEVKQRIEDVASLREKTRKQQSFPTTEAERDWLYHELSLKNIELDILQDIQAQEIRKDNTYNSLRTTIANLTTDYNELKDEKKSALESLTTKKNELKSTKETSNILFDENRRLSNELKLKTVEINGLNSQIKSIEERLEKTSARVTEKIKELRERDQEFSEKNNQLSEKNKEIIDLIKQRDEYHTLIFDLNALKWDNIFHDNRTGLIGSDLKSKITTLGSSYNSARERIIHLEGKLKEIDQVKINALRDNANLKKNANKDNEKITTLESQCTNAQEEINSLNKQIKLLTKERDKGIKDKRLNHIVHIGGSITKTIFSFIPSLPKDNINQAVDNVTNSYHTYSLFAEPKWCAYEITIISLTIFFYFLIKFVYRLLKSIFKKLFFTNNPQTEKTNNSQDINQRIKILEETNEKLQKELNKDKDIF